MQCTESHFERLKEGEKERKVNFFKEETFQERGSLLEYLDFQDLFNSKAF